LSTSSDRQRRLLAELQDHVETGRLGLSDLMVALRPEEMHWLRGPASGEGGDWPPDVWERMQALATLGESRRAAMRPREDAGAREVLAVRVLLIGFAGLERRKMVSLFHAAPENRFLVRAAETVEHARSITSEGGFDIALLSLRPAEESGASQLARLEVATNGIPILAVVAREHADLLGDLGVYDVLAKEDLDAKLLASEVARTLGRRHATESLHDPEAAPMLRDARTGLPERAGIREHLERALSYAERNHEQVAVMALDVDHFDSYAKRLGRDLAEGLMITAADRLRSPGPSACAGGRHARPRPAPRRS
jgi:PleD family two-component response regulator